MLALFGLSLFLLYFIMAGGNRIPAVENGFKPSMLAGAVHLALSEEGKAVQTKDFNFFGTATITSARILMDIDAGIGREQLCLALGKAGGSAFSGGAEAGVENAIRYSAVPSGPYRFSVLCYRADGLLEKLRENEGKGLGANDFSNCSCFCFISLLTISILSENLFFSIS